MPSVGISELALLFVIGLLILGPERLPRVASQLGRWIGRARRTANQLRYQLEREVTLADLDKPKKPEAPRPAVRPETTPKAAAAAPAPTEPTASAAPATADAPRDEPAEGEAAAPSTELPATDPAVSNETIRKS